MTSALAKASASAQYAVQADAATKAAEAASAVAAAEVEAASATASPPLRGALEEGWEEVHNPSSGTYYVNKGTGETTWVKPQLGATTTQHVGEGEVSAEAATAAAAREGKAKLESAATTYFEAEKVSLSARAVAEEKVLVESQAVDAANAAIGRRQQADAAAAQAKQAAHQAEEQAAALAAAATTTMTAAERAARQAQSAHADPDHACRR
jgi:hypothetical protein